MRTVNVQRRCATRIHAGKWCSGSNPHLRFHAVRHRGSHRTQVAEAAARRGWDREEQMELKREDILEKRTYCIHIFRPSLALKSTRKGRPKHSMSPIGQQKAAELGTLCPSFSESPFRLIASFGLINLPCSAMSPLLYERHGGLICHFYARTVLTSRRDPGQPRQSGPSRPSTPSSDCFDKHDF